MLRSVSCVARRWLAALTAVSLCWFAPVQAQTPASPRAGLLRSVDARSRHPSRSVRKRFNYGAKQDRRAAMSATNRELERLARTHPDTVKLTRLSTVDGQPVYRVDVANAPGADHRRATRGRRSAPLRVLISSGVHGNEPTGVDASLALLRKLVRSDRMRQRFSVTMVPTVNPSGLDALTRKDARGIDYNRSFRAGSFVPVTRAVARSVQHEQYDLFLDLHGAVRHGFFLIRGKDDGDLSGRILSAMPSASLLGASAQSPTVGPYKLHGLGAASSNTPGTFKGFMAERATYSYTLEYPRRLPHQRQLSGTMRLLSSALNNVYQHGQSSPR